MKQHCIILAGLLFGGIAVPLAAQTAVIGEDITWDGAWGGGDVSLSVTDNATLTLDAAQTVQNLTVSVAAGKTLTVAGQALTSGTFTVTRVAEEANHVEAAVLFADKTAVPSLGVVTVAAATRLEMTIHSAYVASSTLTSFASSVSGDGTLILAAAGQQSPGNGVSAPLSLSVAQTIIKGNIRLGIGNLTIADSSTVVVSGKKAQFWASGALAFGLRFEGTGRTRTDTYASEGFGALRYGGGTLSGSVDIAADAFARISHHTSTATVFAAPVSGEGALVCGGLYSSSVSQTYTLTKATEGLGGLELYGSGPVTVNVAAAAVTGAAVTFTSAGTLNVKGSNTLASIAGSAKGKITVSGGVTLTVTGDADFSNLAASSGIVSVKGTARIGSAQGLALAEAGALEVVVSASEITAGTVSLKVASGFAVPSTVRAVSADGVALGVRSASVAGETLTVTLAPVYTLEVSGTKTLSESTAWISGWGDRTEEATLQVTLTDGAALTLDDTEVKLLNLTVTAVPDAQSVALTLAGGAKGYTEYNLSALTAVPSVTLRGAFAPNAYAVPATQTLTLADGFHADHLTAAAGSTVAVSSGIVTLASSAQGLKGTLTVEQGATLVSETDGAFAQSGATLNLFGTLDLRTGTWTVNGSTVTFGKPGGTARMLGSGTFKTTRQPQPVTIGGDIVLGPKLQFDNDLHVTFSAAATLTLNGGLHRGGSSDKSLELKGGVGEVLVSGSVVNGIRFVSDGVAMTLEEGVTVSSSLHSVNLNASAAVFTLNGQNLTFNSGSTVKGALRGSGTLTFKSSLSVDTASSAVLDPGIAFAKSVTLKVSNAAEGAELFHCSAPSVETATLLRPESGAWALRSDTEKKGYLLTARPSGAEGVTDEERYLAAAYGLTTGFGAVSTHGTPCIGATTCFSGLPTPTADAAENVLVYDYDFGISGLTIDRDAQAVATAEVRSGDASAVFADGVTLELYDRDAPETVYASATVSGESTATLTVGEQGGVSGRDRVANHPLLVRARK